MKNTEFDPIDLNAAEKTDTETESAEQVSEKADIGEKETNVHKKDVLVSRETILAGTSVGKMYRLFRKDGMSKHESLYNALYLACHNRYEKAPSVVREEFKNIYQHPKGWSGDKRKLHKSDIWSAGLWALNGCAHITHGVKKAARSVGAFFKKLAHIPHSMDNSMRAMRAFGRVVLKAALPVGAAAFMAITAIHIASASRVNCAVGVYIDGEYVGNTLNVGEILDTKRQYESDLSSRYGSPVVLECDISFVPDEYREKDKIMAGDTSIFDTYMAHYTDDGYGLYIDGKLAAVAPVEKWFYDAIADYIRLQEQSYKALYDVSEDEVDRFIYSNNITLISDRYPESYFLSRTEVRKLFSLSSSLSDEDAAFLKNNLHFIKWSDFDGGVSTAAFTYSLKLNYASLGTTARARTASTAVYNMAAPMETVSVDLSVVKDESERVTVPFEVQTIDEDSWPQGMRRLVQNGTDGEKIIYYKSFYQGGKLVKREISGEEILKQAVPKIVRAGTKELTDEEKALIPTGTYIYPYQGKITSTFGWRVIFGSNSFHQGLDIYGKRGDTVVAADGGEVIEVGENKSYGKYCLIRHNEDIVTRYAHCDSITVEQGDLVGQGFPIGTLGATGKVTGVHVHFEIIKDGVKVDPLPYMTGTLPYA